MQFNKSNIKSINLVDSSNISNIHQYNKPFISKTEKVALIEFKKPLNYYKHPRVFQFSSEPKPMEKLYLSLGNPEEFIKDIQN